MRIHGIDSSTLWQNTGIQNHKTEREIMQIKDTFVDNVEISQEAWEKYLHFRENSVKEIEEPQVFTVDNTNEVEFDHYTELKKRTAEILHKQFKERDYDSRDVADATMSAYKTLYEDIINAHKNGDRDAEYDLVGKCKVTLDKDMEALENAFERCVKDTEAFAGIRELNDKVLHSSKADMRWFLDRMGIPAHQDEKIELPQFRKPFNSEYESNIGDILRKARMQFLEKIRISL